MIVLDFDGVPTSSYVLKIAGLFLFYRQVVKAYWLACNKALPESDGLITTLQAKDF